MKTDTYAAERRMAVTLASREPGAGAGEALGDALAVSREHEIVLDGESVQLTYHNEFGPTCAVDDVLERMTLVDYREACATTVTRLLDWVKGAARYRFPKGKYPTVTLVPEPDTPVINTVTLTFTVPPKTYGLLLEAVNRRDGVK